MVGIYCIKNLVNNKMYIGKSVDISNRIYRHYYDLNHNKHYNTHLQRSWNKYGKEAFIWGIIDNYSVDKLDEMEKYWIDYYDSYNNGYNGTVPNGLNNGRLYDDHAKQVHSEAMKHYYKGVSKTEIALKMKDMRKLRVNYSNPNKAMLKLYNTDLELMHELNSTDCANLLGVTPKRLLKSISKIRNSRGLTYKGYIIIKQNESLEEFLKANITNHNKYVVGYNPILQNSEGVFI